MLMQYNQISDIVRSARLCKFFHYIITAIDTMRIWKDKSHFLDTKLAKTNGLKTDDNHFCKLQ